MAPGSAAGYSSEVLRLCIFLCLAVLTAGLPGPGWAQSDVTASTEELIAREKIRAAMEEALTTYLTQTEDGRVHLQNTVTAAEGLLPLGAEIVPFLSQEVELERINTFYFGTYVLGLLGLPECEAPLREAIARAEAEAGDFGTMRKGWAAWSLALMGKADALDLLNTVEHKGAGIPIYRSTSSYEAAALLTYPESLPILVRHLEEWGAIPELAVERHWILKAMGRLADPAAAPAVLPLLGDEDWGIRREAAKALGSLGTPAAIKALLPVLDDHEPSVRATAAVALEQINPAGLHEAAAAELETEDLGVSRAALYRLLARTGHPDILALLDRHWGLPDSRDRVGILEALGILGTPETLPLLRKGLADPEVGVATAAIDELAGMQSRRADDLLVEAVSTAGPTLLPRLLDTLRSRRLTRAAPQISERLLGFLSAPIGDRRMARPVEQMFETLAAFGYTKSAGRLRKASEVQQNRTLRLGLDRVLPLLDAVAANSRKVPRWIEATRSESRDLRILAYRRLGMMNGPQAAAGLVGAFENAELKERLEILLYMGHRDDPATVGLITRILMDPEFDDIRAEPVRNMAAWAAMNIGSPEMRERLVASVERRQGRDAKVIVYAGLAGGPSTLPLFERFRISRLKYLAGERGREQEYLDRVARRLRRGESVDEWKRPPGKIGF